MLSFVLTIKEFDTMLSCVLTIKLAIDILDNSWLQKYYKIIGYINIMSLHPLPI